jgi:hypothetical protein
MGYNEGANPGDGTHPATAAASPEGDISLEARVWNRIRTKTADPNAYWWDNEEEITPRSEDQP